MLTNSDEEATGNLVLTTAEQWMGTPFRHQGRQPGVGLDCAGLLVCVARELGYAYEDVIGYSRLPHHGMLKKTLDSQACLRKVPKNEMAPGDVLLIQFVRAPQHLALYCGEGYILHTFEEVGKVIKHRMNGLWEKRIRGVYRWVREGDNG